jgi:hypothetical protein
MADSTLSNSIDLNSGKVLSHFALGDFVKVFLSFN